MLAFTASNYVQLGKTLEHLKRELEQRTSTPLTDEHRLVIAEMLPEVKKRCEELQLSISQASIEYWEKEFREGRPPTYTHAQCAIEEIERTIYNELGDVRFIYHPRERTAEFIKMSKSIFELKGKPWPTALRNLDESRFAYLTELYTSSVFHSMRSAEKILTTVADQFSIDSRRENWQNIIEQIESAIRKLDELPRGPGKEDKQRFYSEIAIQFRYIKNAWRNHVMHARAIYNEEEAKEVWWHIRKMLDEAIPQLQETIEG